MFRTFATAILTTGLLATTAGAQTMAATGSSFHMASSGAHLDDNWQAMCLAVTGWSPSFLPTAFGTDARSGCNGTFSAANAWTASAVEGWSDGLHEGAKWVTAPAGASVQPGVSNENVNWFYTFRVRLPEVTASGFANVSINTFKMDNYWAGWAIGTGSLWDDVGFAGFSQTGLTCTTTGPTSCQYPGRFWDDMHALNTGDVAVNAGEEYWLYLAITGNGGTDGIFATPEVRFSEVPEPGSAGLAAIGLLGLAAAARRRARTRQLRD